jgi:hypothetical protein
MIPFSARGPFVPFGAIVLATLVSGPVHAADLPVVTKAPPPPAVGSFWAELDYLAWTVKGDRLPALVTTGTTGVLGAPGTTVLFGDARVNDGWRSGGRLQAGYWFDQTRTRGIEASVFALEDASTGFAAASNAAGSPLLARPFFDPILNAQSAMFVAAPGIAAGSVTANETSRLYGAGALYRQSLGMVAGEKVSGLVGYRYLHSSDKLDISSSATSLSILFPPGTTFAANDSFKASSDFHGLDLGLVGEFDRGPWTFEWRAKVALGVNFNDARISGSSSATVGGVTTTSVGGLLALPSNIGSYSQTRFAVVPDLELKAGYQLTPQWRIVAGYEVLYWTAVQRAGGLIDLTVNPNLIPPGPGGGPQRPAPVFDTTSLLAQGFTLGARYSF